MSKDIYRKCTLCKRECKADREKSVGFCKMPSDIYIARAALHLWEEPIISGTRGSGTIFFSGCSLGCAFCQNREISRGPFGAKVDVHRLCEIMLELQDSGAHNINFVTPTHYAPSVKEATSLAKERGLTLPIVYNTGGYDTFKTVRSLSGTVDVYLPDFKFYTSKTAEKYASAPKYPENIREIIDEMVSQTGKAAIGEDGTIRRGVVVRILLLPSHVAEAKLTVKYLYERYGDDIYLSLMSQYTPMPDMAKPLSRKVTREEYRELVEYADKIGVTHAFIQDSASATDSYVPAFDGTGVVKSS